MMKLATLISTLIVVPALSFADDAAKAHLLEVGKTSFATCAACHGPDGKGLAVGTSKMAPSFEGSKIVNGDPAVLALLILKGIQKEGTDYMGMMMPLGGALDDEKLAGVMTYLRGSFGNTASVVTADDAKKYREQWKDIAAPVTRAKLAELAAKP